MEYSILLFYCFWNKSFTFSRAHFTKIEFPSDAKNGKKKKKNQNNIDSDKTENQKIIKIAAGSGNLMILILNSIMLNQAKWEITNWYLTDRI